MQGNEDKLIKSMEFCQSTITRLSGNSFQLKTWFLVSFTALFTFFAKSISGEIKYAPTIFDLIWLGPLLVFPFLDAYYLKQERVFRSVYNDFKNKINSKDNPREFFDLKPTKAQIDEFNILNIVFSISVGFLYLPLLATFQALIIHHSIDSNIRYLYMIIFPVILIISSLVFEKGTSHNKMGVK